MARTQREAGLLICANPIGRFIDNFEIGIFVEEFAGGNFWGEERLPMGSQFNRIAPLDYARSKSLHLPIDPAEICLQ